MSDSRMKPDSRDLANGSRPRGFTLLELLVVIGIIVILIGILIPTISHVRQAARATSTQSLLVELQTAIEQYHTDYHAYPGPLSNDVMYVDSATGFTIGNLPVANRNQVRAFNPATNTYVPFQGYATGSENLVLGLLGGLRVDPAIAGINISKVIYDPTIVGTGPRTLAYDFANGIATAKTNQAKSAYLNSVADISTGHFKDQSGEANDSVIPEFVDRFPSPMPILYLRARVAAPANFQVGPVGNPWYYVISDVGDGTTGVRGRPSVGTLGGCQYDINQIFGYVGAFTGVWPAATAAALDVQDRLNTNLYSCIGEGKSAVYWHGPANAGPYEADNFPNGYAPYHGLFAMMPYALGNVGDPNGVTPAPAPDYFRNPAFGTADMAPASAVQRAQNQPRGKDTYILISPGPDRVYGTADDITSFGPVMP